VLRGRRCEAQRHIINVGGLRSVHPETLKTMKDESGGARKR
jgi:hypothetical protein